MSASASAPPQVRWDLSALFSGNDDPKIQESWERAHAAADTFAAKYRGQIDVPDLSPATLATALKELEDLVAQASKPINFAHLQFACDTGNAALGAFLQKQMEKSTELSVKLMFFDLELQAAPDEVIQRGDQ